MEHHQNKISPDASFNKKKWQILKDIFGYSSFRGNQEEIINCVLSGQNVLALMPTGAGKSLCFQIPALTFGGLSLVISPLVALMEDQVANLKLSGVQADTINSGRPRTQNIETWRMVQRGEINLLYLAPERLMDKRMLTALARLPVNLIAIDEAHCLSQWGPSFRPEYAMLGTLTQHFENIPIIALTATADEATRKDIQTQLFNGENQLFVSGFDRPNIHLSVTQKKNWKEQLLDFVLKRPKTNGIIYCLSRRKTEDVAELLGEKNINALAYHAGLTTRERTERQNRFLTEDGLVMVATIAFGMGIDKANIRYVFHTDLPSSIEAYYQEIGRAGRDGAPAEAHMIFGAGDIRLRRQFIDEEDSDNDRKWRENQRLDALIAYADSMTCRRQALLSYFGEEKSSCNTCDICDNPVDLIDGTQDAFMVFDAIFETGELYGQAHIIDVLIGAKTEKTKKTGHQALDCYGVARGSFNKESLKSLIRQMISTGFLEIDVAGYGSLSITQKGNALSRGKESFFYRKESIPAPKPKRQKTFIQQPEKPDLSDNDETLLSALKERRLELAREKGVPAFVILHDKTLEEMAYYKPRTLDALGRIKGIGQAKMNNFGQIFLNVILNKAH